MDWTPVLEMIPEGIAALVAMGIAYAARKRWITQDAATAAKEAVGAIVNETYQEFVKTLKKDGEFDLSKQEEARKLALDKLIDKGKSEGIDYVKNHGIDNVMLWVEEWVQKNKKK